MKTTEIFLNTEKSHSGATLKKAKTGKGLKYLLILFMLSWVGFLPSCAVAVRTPQPSIAVENHNHRMFHRNQNHRSHNEYRDRDDHRR